MSSQIQERALVKRRENYGEKTGNIPSLSIHPLRANAFDSVVKPSKTKTKEIAMAHHKGSPQTVP